MPDLILTEDELLALTGYSQPARQLAELHRLGFWRARRTPIAGQVVLTRAHYDSVERGDTMPKPGPMLRPRLRTA